MLEGTDGGEAPGLVLPEEVVASLAGQLAERARSGEPAVLTGPGGLLTGVIGQVLQAGLAAELGAHLEDAGGDGGGNRRNGSSAKTLNTEVGPVRLAVPRDRDDSFVPALVPKQATRSDGLNAVIIGLYAKGMSVRDIARHGAADGGGEPVAGHDLAGDRRGAGADAGVAAPAAGAVLPGGLHRRAGREGPRRRRGAEQGDEHRGRDRRRRGQAGAGDLGRRVRGLWALAQLRNRGLEEVLFVCCDGLSGLGEEITATWPETTVQTCVVHLIRRSLNYASYTDRKAMAAGLRAVYTACEADAAYAAPRASAGEQRSTRCRKGGRLRRLNKNGRA